MGIRVVAVIAGEDCPEAQLAAIRTWAEANDGDVVAVVDEPEAVVTIFEAGQADLAVSTRWSGFGTDAAAAHSLLHRIESLSGRAQACLEPLETSTAAGRLARSLILSATQVNELDAPIGAEVRFDDLPEAPAPLPRRAIGYVRVSLSREEMISPAIQEQHILEHCRRRGYVHLGALADLDLSGRSFKKRERIRQAVQMVADGEVEVIVVWKWSRFGRNARESMINLGIIENDLGGIVESATEDFDSKTPVGNFQRGFFLQLAEFESDRFGEIWRDVHARRARQGLTHNGGKRLGYRQDPRASDDYIPELTSADGAPGLGTALADCYRAYIAGAGFSSLAARLNAQGFRTHQGNDFNATSLRAAMDSGFAAGLLPFIVKEGDRRTRRFRRGRHEPLIDMPTWQAYRQERARRRATGARTPSRTFSRLSGVLRCPYCLSAMTHGRTGSSDGTGKSYSFYSCSMSRRGSRCPGTSITAAHVEDQVQVWLTSVLRSSFHDHEQAQQEVLGRLASARSRLAAVNQEVRELQAQHAEGDFSAAELYESVLQREPARKELRDQVDDLTRRAAVLAQADVDIARRLLEQWDDIAPSEVNRVLRQLLHRIYVFSGRRGVKTDAASRLVFVPIWDEVDAVARAHKDGRPPRPELDASRQPPPGATRLRLLETLADQGPATPGQLSDVVGVTPQSVRVQLRRMVASGLVERAGCVEVVMPGRPARIYAVTADGLAVLARERERVAVIMGFRTARPAPPP
jgi:site-specific DNA recombinase